MRGGLKDKPNQRERIIDYIMRKGGITSLDAYMDLGITQLGARIWELKNKDGYKFGERMISVVNRHGEKCKVKEYYLVRRG